MKIGKTVLEMIKNDNGDELDAVRKHNDAIKTGREVNDQGTVDLLTKIPQNGRRPMSTGQKCNRSRLSKWVLKTILLTKLKALQVEFRRGIRVQY